MKDPLIERSEIVWDASPTIGGAKHPARKWRNTAQLTIERLRMYAKPGKVRPPYIGIPQDGKPPLIFSEVHLRAALAADTHFAELKKAGVCTRDDRFPLELNGGRAVYRLPVFQNGRSPYKGLDVRTCNVKWAEKQRKRIAAAPKPKGKQAQYLAKLEKELAKDFPRGRPEHPAFPHGKAAEDYERTAELDWHNGKADRQRVSRLVSKALAVNKDLLDRPELLRALWAEINPEAEYSQWYAFTNSEELFLRAYRSLWGQSKPEFWACARRIKNGEDDGKIRRRERRTWWAEILREYDATMAEITNQREVIKAMQGSKRIQERANSYLSYWLRGTLQSNITVSPEDIAAVWETCKAHAEESFGL